MPEADIPYEKLPDPVKDNLTEEQWREARRGVVHESQEIPETTIYINLKTAQQLPYEAGMRANAPLLPVHDLSGGRGADSSQFHTSPPGAHGVPYRECAPP